jgi:hypothetical protein
MRRAGGYSICWQPGLPDQEWDTFTCNHCNVVRFLAPRQEPEFRCKNCYGYICEACVNKGCLPLEEQLRMMESPTYRPRRVFKIARP